VVKPGPGLRDSGGVGQHADGPLHLSEVSAGDDSWRLVVDPDLEPGGAPVHKLDAALGLDGGDGGVDVLGHDVAAVEQAAGHVLAVSGVTLDHLVGGLEAGVGDLADGELLVVGLLRGDDRRVGHQREVDPGIGDQVSLELGEVDVEGAVEPQRGRDRGHDLPDQPVEVGVRRPLNVEVPAADIVDGFVVHHEGAV